MMYSRDVFPRYSSGGLPIPENYSGNAIRRTPPSGNGAPSGSRTNGRSEMASGAGGTPRVHTPMPRTPSGQSRGTHAQGNVPLTVSPAFAARNAPPVEEELHGSMQGEERETDRDALREEGAGGGEQAEAPGDGFRGGGAQEGSSLGRESFDRPQEPPAEAATAKAHPQESGGLSSLLSAFLPPKPGGGGVLSQIGLEEALLLGLFLLLSQSEEEEDTLMLLALLFLYR